MDKALMEFDALCKRVEKFESNFKKCSKANRTIGYLEGRIVGLVELWKLVCDVDGKIESLKTDQNANDTYFDDDKFGVLEEKYFNLMGEVKEQLRAIQPQPNNNQNQQQQGSNQNQRGNAQDNEASVKLPKIELPTFEGSYLTWLSFKNQFTSLIADNAKLSNIQKLQYLKSCCKFDAETAINRYQITDANYEAAWDRLNEIYDNKRMLQDIQIEQIIDRKEVKVESAKELRDLLDVVQESLEALRNMNVDTGTWDPMLVVLIKRKLPFKTREKWENGLEPKDVPTYAQLVAFLEKRYRTVENLELVGSSEGNSKHESSSSKGRNQSLSQRQNCWVCNSSKHTIIICEKFLNMNLSNRIAFVTAKKLCKNCLLGGHETRDCRNIKRCFNCKGFHHTLLHREESNKSQEPSYSGKNLYSNGQYDQWRNTQYKKSNGPSFGSRNNQNYSGRDQRNQQNNNGQSSDQSNLNSREKSDSEARRNLTTINEPVQVLGRGARETLFPTAIIQVRSEGGIIYNLRALLDQCSEDVFIKESVVKMLGAKQIPIPAFDVTGLEDVVTSTVRTAVKFQMVIEKKETLELEAKICKNLVGILPKSEKGWPKDLFKNLKLADPQYATPNNVDIMLGSEVYQNIILSGVLKEEGFLAQNTKLGWIISGRSEGEDVRPKKRTLLCLQTRKEEQAEEILRRFWEIEESPRRKQKFTDEEIECEKRFVESYRRLEDGRPQVKLPFKENPSENLGESRNQAVARWISMERKLEKDQKLKKDYFEAIQEHLDLGHMEKVNKHNGLIKMMSENGKICYDGYYIPHHSVVNEESKTTKTRIVFDASAKTYTGKSLNDLLLVGPTIQESLIVRLMKWRSKKIALRGDVTKMYRQIKVYEEDKRFQRMVFRFDKKQPIEDYELNTLTFGTASAPFMAIRTLQQLAKDGQEEYPVGSDVVKTDFHVDDLLTGGDTVEEVQKIWQEVREMLIKAKFPMRKWSSNSNEVLKQIPKNEREFKAEEIKIEDTLKTLGIGWSPIEDYFFFKAPEFDVREKLTKRTFLSQAGKLFDPLGWLGPAVMKPKIMFQKMWKEGLGWDELLSKELADEWLEFREELKLLEQIKIPRWFGNVKDAKVELHAFCDASERAYGCVIYIKTTNKGGQVKIELVLAKSRVAPVQTIRLPRLELCGAVLLANLIDLVKKELDIEDVYCWTDSSITLDWINSMADKHKTFVANRIVEIQEFTKPEQWRHVEGTQNPADCLSRGMSPRELLENKLWWNGPEWLKLSKEKWPKNPYVTIPEDQKELKGKKVLATSKLEENEVIKKLLKRYNSFKKLIRVSARIRTVKNKEKHEILSPEELENERIFWIKSVQKMEFRDEIKSIKKEGKVSPKSKLISLLPFLDSEGILRVGGRLKEANVDYDNKHQILIPKNTSLARMIINDSHEATMHGGTQLTTTHTRMNYWIINTRKSVRSKIHKCVKCHRYAQNFQGQLMGKLPKERVNMVRSFLYAGIDYAGPIKILTRRKPGKREVTKGWIALFVCLSTKAIHLEVVSKLASKEFLQAFTRFQCRRGLPAKMYSDNSTTFIGAKNELEEDLKIIKEQLEPKLAEVIIKNGIEWKFIPPHSPHWGGLWESGVKSMKTHLKRVVGDVIYTFEEVTTLLAEIEAVLNSRPLCPITDDPNDLSVLTPGHFLIGDSLLLPPRPSLLDINPNRLGIYKQISQRVEHFARRWKQEYLNTLQHRRKWIEKKENVQIGEIGLIRDDDYPPAKWKIGRVIEVFPDEEGLVRKVMLKTENGTLLRPIHKISILPIERAVDPSPEK